MSLPAKSTRPRRRLQESDRDAADRRLARSGLSDQRQRLAMRHSQTHSGDCRDRPPRKSPFRVWKITDTSSSAQQGSQFRRDCRRNEERLSQGGPALGEVAIS